ncbi:MAG: hypothetical protein CMJ49_09570 [Planctomycetaceae bacterium]|nr:hypothetical protein [Planctomycetaceae bacterium]
MKYAQLPDIEKQLSVICLGTGGYGSEISPSDSFKLLDRFVELGGTFMDTAHVYGAWDSSGYNGGYGNSEKVIGEWLKKTAMHNKITVGTKGAHPDLDTGVPRMNAKDINTHISQSLERLKTDAIDLYWLHTDDPAIPAAEILGMIAEHVAAGRLNAIGCSNWSVQRQQEATDAAAELALPAFVASQVGWSFARATSPVYSPGYVDMRYMDPDMHRYHVRTGIPVAAYSAQACGYFAQKYDGLDFTSSDVPNPALAARYGNDLTYHRREAAVELARQFGCTANQIALAWMTHQPFPAFPIAGVNSLQKMDDAIKAADIQLTDDQFNELACGQEG